MAVTKFSFGINFVELFINGNCWRRVLFFLQIVSCRIQNQLFRLYCSVDIGNPSSFYIFDDSILLLGLYPPINWLQCLFCQSREYGPRPLLYMIGAGLPVTYNYMGIQVGLAIMSVRCNGRKHYSSHHRPPWPRRHPCCPCSSLTSLSFPSRSRQPNLVHRHSLLPNHTIVCPTLSSLTAP
jgi:hypothetical protein